jgi:cytochrome c
LKQSRKTIQADMNSKALFAAPPLLAALLLTAQAPATAAPPDGATVFRQRCQTCHTVAAGKASPLGPNLAGVVGRRAAATSFNYTPALKGSKLVWNRATLDRFLTAPTRMVPGTRMVMPVTDPQQRAALLDFLTRTGSP